MSVRLQREFHDTFVYFLLGPHWHTVNIYIFYPLDNAVTTRVEAGSNTSTIALRDVGGDEKENQCLGVKLGHPVPGGYEYGDLALQVGEVSNLRQ
jgi:hypothetical protein